MCVCVPADVRCFVWKALWVEDGRGSFVGAQGSFGRRISGSFDRL